MEFKQYPPALFTSQQSLIVFPDVNNDHVEQQGGRRINNGNPKYYLQKKSGERYFAPYPASMCVRKYQAMETRRIRYALSLRVPYVLKQSAIGISATALRYKEYGKYNMLKTEYVALMKLYREVKLRRIFGKNYREELFS